MKVEVSVIMITLLNYRGPWHEEFQPMCRHEVARWQTRVLGTSTLLHDNVEPQVAMMGGKIPRMDRGPFLGPNGPFLDDIVEPLTEVNSQTEVVDFFNYEVSLPNDTQLASNDTYNDTNIILEYDTYPSGYTWLQIILLAILVTSVMVVIVVGNMLVIIAIATEKSLKNITNWFIASLAVADLLLGLLIMPFSLANLLMGYWIFGDLWCELHSAIDVLLSTASINNICLISLDRYWSITHAVAYLKKRTPERSAIMIVLVWVFSGLVSIPPLLGWKKPAVPQTFPKCEASKYHDRHYLLSFENTNTLRLIINLYSRASSVLV